MSSLQSFLDAPPLKLSIPRSAGAAAAVDKVIDQSIRRTLAERPDVRMRPTDVDANNLEIDIFNTLSAFKIYLSQISMHLDTRWRHRLFVLLDDLYDTRSWDPEDPITPLASFQTFVRLMLIIQPSRFPGVGISGDKGFAAAWYLGADRLTIYAYPNDKVRYNVSVKEGDTANGTTHIQNFVARIESFNPERWFNE